jgi:hypothetical protein
MRDLLRVFDQLWPQPEEAVVRSATVIAERRAADRLTGSALATLARVTVYPGIDASVVNLSCAGALCESQTKLAPHTPVRLRIEFADRREIHVDGMVLRCSLHTISAQQLLYRSAIRFFRPIALAGVSA